MSEPVQQVADRWPDLFDPSHYDDDLLVRVSLGEARLELSERLWERLRDLGWAGRRGVELVPARHAARAAGGGGRRQR
jgi:hypothetical protein